MKAARSPTPLPTLDFKHPVNPDLAPSHFWNLLADLRKTPVLSAGVQPTVLPQIVPKLDLSRVPSANIGKGMSLLKKTTPHQESNREHENKDDIVGSSRSSFIDSRAVRLGSGLHTPQTEKAPSRKNPQREAESAKAAIHQKRRIVATDKEIMSLQHRKLGINPWGRIWDLRRQLNADDRTLQVMQVAAAVLGNPNLEVRVL